MSEEQIINNITSSDDIFQENHSILERNRKIERRRKYYRTFPLLFSILFIYLGIYIYREEFNIEGFGITIDYNGEQFLPLTPFLGVFSLTLGMWALARTIKWNKTANRENMWYLAHVSYEKEKVKEEVKFRSFSSSRLFIALIMLAMVLVNYLKFGFFIGQRNRTGSWQFLGGPSMFFPMGIIPMLIALGLLIYPILSLGLFRITSTDTHYCFEEYRLLAPWMTEIRKEDVRGVRIKNSHTGPRYVWILVIGFHAIYCLVNGYFFLTNEFAFGSGPEVGKYYILTGLVQLLCLFLLLFRHQQFIEIVTDEKRYELYFSAPAANPNTLSDIEELFGIPGLSERVKLFNKYREDLGPEQNKLQEIKGNSNRDNLIGKIREKLNIKYCADWRNILIGTFIIGFSCYCEATPGVYAGSVLRYFLYFYGAYLIIKGLKNDIYTDNNTVVVYDEEKKELFWRKKRGMFNDSYKVRDVSKEEFSIEDRILRLNFWDVFYATIILFIIGWDLISQFYFLSDIKLNFPEAAPYAKNIYFRHIFFAILLTILILINVIHPNKSVNVKTKSIDFEFQINCTSRNPIETWKYVIKNQTKVFVLRILMVVLLLFIGCLYFGTIVGSTGIIVTFSLLVIFNGLFILNFLILDNPLKIKMFDKLV